MAELALRHRICDRLSLEMATRFDLRTLFERSVDRGLACVLDPDPDSSPTLPRHLEHIRIFILHHDQMWRVPAFHALWTDLFKHGGWSDAAENQCSLLLGYTPRQRVAWMAEQRWRWAAWGCSTLYTLLDAHQKARVLALGHRCLGSPTEVEGLILFMHGRHHDLQRRAAALVPKGLTLARVGLRSNVELLGPRGWR